MKSIVAVGLLSSALIISACSQPKSNVADTSGAPAKQKLVNNSPEFESLTIDLAKGAKVGPKTKKMIEGFNQNHEIDREALRSVVLSLQAAQYNSLNSSDQKISQKISSDELLIGFILDAAKNLKGTAFLDLNVTLERHIVARTGSPLLYNKEAKTVAHPIKNSRMQCLSGTLSYILIANELLDKNQRNDLVVILEPGHVLPAIVQKEDNRFTLTGVETTKSGPALVKYGYTDELLNLQKPIRVVRADVFLLLSATAEVAGNQEALVAAAIADTARRYDIDYNELEKLVQQAKTKEDDKSLVFGTSNVPAGDLSRDFLDEKVLHPPTQNPSAGSVDPGVVALNNTYGYHESPETKLVKMATRLRASLASKQVVATFSEEFGSFLNGEEFSLTKILSVPQYFGGSYSISSAETNPQFQSAVAFQLATSSRRLLNLVIVPLQAMGSYYSGGQTKSEYRCSLNRHSAWVFGANFQDLLACNVEESADGSLTVSLFEFREGGGEAPTIKLTAKH